MNAAYRAVRPRPPSHCWAAVLTVTINQMGNTSTIGLVMSRDAAMASLDGLKGTNCAAMKRRKMNRNITPTMLL